MIKLHAKSQQLCNNFSCYSYLLDNELVNSPKYLTWQSLPELPAHYDPITVDTSQVVHTEHTMHFSKNGIVWLIEPREYMPRSYDFVSINLNKFSKIWTHDKQLLTSCSKAVFVPYGGCWIKESERQIYNKTKNISMIVSANKYMTGHILRHSIADELKNYIDLYGRHCNPIDNKVKGLRDYRYSITVENTKADYWFTEKVIDCFKTGTIPVYWGCPSIYNFFNVDGMVLFDSVEDLKQKLPLLTEDYYQSKLPIIQENFERANNYIIAEDWIYKNLVKNGTYL